MPLLRAERVDVSYGSLRALRGFDVAVPDGACCAILGPNGAGKSTALRAISGLAAIASGRIDFDGTRIDGMPPHAIARLGIVHVPEGRAVFGSLTVGEHLRLAGGEAVLDLFGSLRPLRGRPAGTLSGGEQRMLSLARAFARRPRLLLLDEPSLGLAPVLVEELYAAIGALRSERVSILLVEQQVPRALELADLVWVLAGGEVAFAGEPQELRADATLVESYLGR